MSQYLLPCSCGSKISVSRSQAGMTIVCPSCNANVDIPTIRGFAGLEMDTSKSSNSHDRKSGGLLAVVAGLLLLVGIGASIRAGYMIYERTYSPLRRWDLTEQDYIDNFAKSAEKASPAETWDYWNELSLQGLSRPETPEYFMYKRYLNARLPEMQEWIATSIICFVSFGVLLFVIQKKQRKKTV